MAVSYGRLQTIEEARQVEALNEANMLEHLSAERAQTQGFLTALYPADLLLRMAAQTPAVIATRHGRVVGFLILNSSVTHLPQHKAAMSALGQHLYRDKPLTAYRFLRCGPLCVALEARGCGIAKALYAFVTREYSHFDLLVVRVNQRNSPSFQAHLRLGFCQFATQSGPVTWVHMARELRASHL